MSVNKAIILGRLGNDPEIRYTPDGKAVVNLSVATSEKYKDKSGAPQEATEWHRVTIFGKQAELAGEYLKKGSQVYLEGKITTRKWQDNSGQDRYTTEIVLSGYNSVMQFISDSQGKAENNGRSNQRNNSYDNSDYKAPQQQQRQQQGQGKQEPPEFGYDDSIPF